MISLKKFKKKKINSLDKPLLVFVSDGFSLLATVAAKKEGEITIAASARSGIADPVSALVEVLGRLSVSYGKLPKDSILLHANAVPSILELAIANVESLEEEKIQELVRWEMESVFSDLVPNDNLGWLMVGLGYITEQQRDSLIHSLAAENQDNRKKVRLGDIAISQGYINRNQLEECLKAQDQMQLQDQRIKCGWSYFKDAEKTHWLATAVSESIHKQWVSAVEAVTAKGALGKSKLKSIYPYIGSGSSQLNHIYSTENVYILELHRAYLALNVYNNGALIDCLILECSSDTPSLNDIEALINNAEVIEGADIFITVTHADRYALREELEKLHQFNFKHMEREISMPAQIAGDVSSAEAIMIFGAAFNYFSKNHQLMVPIQGVNPPLPFHQRPETKVAGIILAILCVVGVVEGGFAWKIGKQESKLTRVKDQVRLQEVVKKDMNKSKKAQAKLDRLEQEYQGLIELKKLMETVLVSRNSFMTGFLDMIVFNINDNLIIDSIIEERWNEFVIHGWSVDQASIEYFAQGLTRDLSNWNMEITDNPSELGRSTNGFSGYKFKVVIKKIKTGLNTTVSNNNFLTRERI